MCVYICSAEYNSQNGGPVNVEGELDCDFDNNCCWNNAAPPVDQLEWNVGTGAIDPEKAQISFGTNQPPGNKIVFLPFFDSI